LIQNSDRHNYGNSVLYFGENQIAGLWHLCGRANPLSKSRVAGTPERPERVWIRNRESAAHRMVAANQARSAKEGSAQSVEKQDRSGACGDRGECVHGTALGFQRSNVITTNYVLD
jgi:hypothetical protein